MRLLRRFWFTFGEPSRPSALNLGCGVTAADRADAVRLLRERVFEGGELPEIAEVVEDVDVSLLDPRHVLPNMGSVTIRGIWFPLGY